jgi:long-chain fatty acid transport protein
VISKSALILLLILTVFCASGYPAGFLVYTQDAASAGMANAFTAVADNASAVFYNPAGINQLEGTQVRSGFMVYYADTYFRGSESGDKTKMHEVPSALVTGYLTHKINDKISIGSGIFSPFGLVTEWPSRWEGDYVSTYGALRTIFFNPVVSVQVHPRLAIAAGIDYVYSDFKIRRSISLSQLTGIPLGLSLGKITLDGSDDSWGYNLGMLFHINDTWSLGVSYRSKVNLEFDGHANYRMRPILRPLFSPTDISPRMELPPIISTQIAAQFIGKWTLATGILWTGWSVFDELTPKFRNDILIPQRMKSSPQDWEDVLAFHLGMQYQLNHDWTLRSGYIYDESPVPERTLGPMIPDVDGHILSLGTGYTSGNFTIDVAGMGLLPTTRHTRRNNDGLNGKYSTTWIAFLTSITYCF